MSNSNATHNSAIVTNYVRVCRIAVWFLWFVLGIVAPIVEYAAGFQVGSFTPDLTNSSASIAIASIPLLIGVGIRAVSFRPLRPGLTVPLFGVGLGMGGITRVGFPALFVSSSLLPVFHLLAYALTIAYFPLFVKFGDTSPKELANFEQLSSRRQSSNF